MVLTENRNSVYSILKNVATQGNTTNLFGYLKSTQALYEGCKAFASVTQYKKDSKNKLIDKSNADVLSYRISSVTKIMNPL